MARTDSLESLIDDIVDDLDETIYVGLFAASDAAIDLSPVDTSRFKNAWRVGVDNYIAEESSNVYDLSGGAAQRIIADQVTDFSIINNDSVTLYNNVLDPETDFNYAQTVGYDFTGNKAFDLMSDTEQVLYSSLG